MRADVERGRGLCGVEELGVAFGFSGEGATLSRNCRRIVPMSGAGRKRNVTPHCRDWARQKKAQSIRP